jgi:hypothetical protein
VKVGDIKAIVTGAASAIVRRVAGRDVDGGAAL